MNETVEFESCRPMLFSIAYRMLGSAAEAEDVVQDAWLRAAREPAAEIRSPKAWLGTVVTRLALDRLKSARAAREEYVGPWLPEPVLTAQEHVDPAIRSETMTFAFMTLLESLTPAERAAYVLREAFDYGHAEIAEVLETSTANARQLLHRARTAVAAAKPRFPATREQADAIVERFRGALVDGDMDEVTRLLTEEVTFRADGGGKALATRVPVSGRRPVARLFASFQRAAAVRALDVRTELHEVNGEPGIVVWVGAVLETVFSFTATADGISDIRAVRNPDKLARIARMLATRA